MRVSRGLFVTGTDTGVGKTLVVSVLGALLTAEGIPFGVCKPVETGALRGRSLDIRVYKRFFTPSGPDAEVVPLLWKAPQAPSIAAALEKSKSRVEKLKRSLYILKKKHVSLLVEGAGGLLVPINGNFLMRDLIQFSGLPALVVARPSLGTLNHTALTFSELRRCGIPAAGFVVSGVESPSGRLFLKVVAEMERLTRRPYLGALKKFSRITRESVPAILKSARRTLRLKALLGYFR